MSSSIPNHKFLIDENVHRKLYKFLKDRNFDVKLAPNGTADKNLAQLSKTESRILVTNDEDFTYYADNVLYSVIWLKLPQGDDEGLTTSFEILIKEFTNFSGKLVILEKNKWTEHPLK